VFQVFRLHVKRRSKGYYSWNTYPIPRIRRFRKPPVKRWNTWNTFSSRVGTEHRKPVSDGVQNLPIST